MAWTGSACTSSTTTLNAEGVATCSISDAQASIAYSVTAAFTDTDRRYINSSSSDSTAVVGKATPIAPTITNLPTSGAFGGGFTAVVTHQRRRHDVSHVEYARRLLHQRPCGHLRRRRHVLPERPGGCE